MGPELVIREASGAGAVGAESGAASGAEGAAGLSAGPPGIPEEAVRVGAAIGGGGYQGLVAEQE